MKELKDLNFYEMFSYSTTRIECILKDGSKSTGTGFFIYLNDFKNKDEIPRVALITNKHVIKDSVEGLLTLTRQKNGKILNTEHFKVPHDDFESAWYPHPDKDIDLCMLNFNPMETLFNGNGIDLFYFPIPIMISPDKKTMATFDTMEEVLMIGYPNGIWDSINNKPIFRKGVTATDYRLNYEDKPLFLIDIAVYNGSSGSPVLMTRIAYEEKDGEQIPRREIYLLGVLFAGFQHMASGEFKILEIPQIQKNIVTTYVPNNLGLVIKSEKLFEFRKLFYD